MRLVLVELIFELALDVVIAIRKTEAVAVELQHVFGRVCEVGVGRSVPQHPNAGLVKRGERGEPGFGVFDLGCLIEQRLDAGETFFLDGRIVHARRVVVTDLGRDVVFAELAGTSVVEDRAQRGLVGVVDLGEARPLRAVVGNFLRRHPTAAGELVKIDARIGFAIEGVWLEANVGKGKLLRWLCRRRRRDITRGDRLGIGSHVDARYRALTSDES